MQNQEFLLNEYYCHKTNVILTEVTRFDMYILR